MVSGREVASRSVRARRPAPQCQRHQDADPHEPCPFRVDLAERRAPIAAPTSITGVNSANRMSGWVEQAVSIGGLEGCDHCDVDDVIGAAASTEVVQHAIEAL